MTENELKNLILKQAENMAKALSSGKEIEIRTAKDGIAVYANKRRKIDYD